MVKQLIDKGLRALGLRRVNNSTIPAGSMDFGTLFKWIMSSSTLDRDMHGQLEIQRREARRLARENPLVKQYLNLLCNNVIGPNGMDLEAQVRNNDGSLNKPFNDKIEFGWAEFWKSPWADGRLSGIQGEKLVLKTVANDGEALVRKLRGFPNKFGLALQMLDPELLDHTYNVARTGASNEIRLGVEVDTYGRPLAYWFWTAFADQGGDRSRIRIPANEIIHVYDPDRISQTRGITWHYSVMLPLKMINGFVEAALVAERTAACAFPVFKQSMPDAADESAKDYSVELNPGTGFTLPFGLDMQSFVPNTSSTSFTEFIKSGSRFVASAWGVSYNALANDLEGVNYSSMRSGLLIERDSWRSLQRLWIDRFLQPVYEEFITCALLVGAVKLDSRDPQKFLNVSWTPRGWAWVDPLKDINAAVIAIENGLGSRTSYLAEQGISFEDVCEKLADEKNTAADAGLDFSGAAVSAKDVTLQTEEETATTPPAKNRLRLAVLNALLDDEQVDRERLDNLLSLYRKGA